MIYLYLFGTCFHFIYVFMIIGNYFHCDKSNEYCYNKLLCQTIPNQKNQVLSAFDLSAFRNQES